MQLFELKEWTGFRIPRDMVDQDLLAAGWVPFWFGLCKQPVNRCYKTGDLERFVFLSLMEFYAGRHVDLFQLGSGLGNWSMALAAAVRFKRTPGPASYRCLAVEAEPTHYKWTKECFKANKVDNATVVHGAVCEEDGKRFFQLSPTPPTSYGQSIVPPFTKDSIMVNAYTVDSLRARHGFDHVHIVQVDVQGSEADVVRGCRGSVGSIDFFMIETHNPNVEQELKALLVKSHDLVVELPCEGRLELSSFSLPFLGIGGGFHLWQRKGRVWRVHGLVASGIAK